MSDEHEASLLDCGKRASDAVALALLADPAGNIGRWVALRLSDGGTDGVVYDRKLDAVVHQLHPHQCAYVCIDPMGMTPATAARYIELHRQLYAMGMRVAVDADVRPGFQTGN